MPLQIHCCFLGCIVKLFLGCIVILLWNSLFYNINHWCLLTHCGVAVSYYIVYMILVNTDSGNGLMHDGTKPLPEPMLTFQGMFTNTLMLNVSILQLCLKFTHLKSRQYHTGDNDLKYNHVAIWHFPTTMRLHHAISYIHVLAGK